MTSSAPRRIAVAVGVLGLGLGLAFAWRAGYLPFLGGGPEKPGPARPGDGDKGGRGGGGDAVVAVTAAKLSRLDVPVTLDAVGTAQALNSVTIRTQVDGRLIKLAIAEGQDVKQGDVIAQIDPSLYQAAYDQARAKKAQDEANLANARLDLLRYQKLVAGNFASKQQFATQKALVAQLEALVRADQAAIDNAKTTLDFATIRSPIDGRVGIRLVDVGNILHPSDPVGIVVITQLRPIYVVFTIPQQSLPALQKAQSAGAVKVAALGPDNASQIELGQVSVIDNQVDQQTGTVRVKATFANPHLQLWPGQFVNVRVTVDTLKQALTAPSQAVQRGPSGPFVYVLRDDNVAVLKPVSVGRQDEQIAVITQGLDANAKVIVSGFARLADGAKVRVADEAGRDAAESGGRRREKGGAPQK